MFSRISNNRGQGWTVWCTHLHSLSPHCIAIAYRHIGLYDKSLKLTIHTKVKKFKKIILTIHMWGVGFCYWFINPFKPSKKSVLWNLYISALPHGMTFDWDCCTYIPSFFGVSFQAFLFLCEIFPHLCVSANDNAPGSQVGREKGKASSLLFINHHH